MRRNHISKLEKHSENTELRQPNSQHIVCYTQHNLVRVHVRVEDVPGSPPVMEADYLKRTTREPVPVVMYSMYRQ